jgi:predicted MFS family arabinose efflux permease
MTVAAIEPTTDLRVSQPPCAVRPRLLSPGLVRVFGCEFGALTSFYLLLSVVPLYAASRGVASNAAGLATGALMLSTVAAELATPRLVSRFGYRVVLAAALLLMGAPALALSGAASAAAIVAVCVVRGLGFGIVVVVGGALVATFVPPERRGEGLGIYGVVSGVPAVVALPLGLWLVGYVGYLPVFVAGAVAALAGLAVVPGLPGRAPGVQPQVGVLVAMRTPALLRPSIVFAATTVAAGVVVTFLPVATHHASTDLAAVALLAHAVAATGSRWWAGRYGDVHGSRRLLLPGLLASAGGVLALVLLAHPVAVVVAMVVFGAGFGVTQNASLALMFERVPEGGYGAASALWSLAYDGGLGLGAAGFGVVAMWTGYPAAFAVTAAVMLTTLAPACRDLGRGKGQ